MRHLHATSGTSFNKNMLNVYLITYHPSTIKYFPIEVITTYMVTKLEPKAKAKNSSIIKIILYHIV